MNTPDEKISKLLANMDVAEDPKTARLMALLVDNGTVDLDLRITITSNLGIDLDLTLAEAIGQRAVSNGNTNNLLALGDTLDDDVLCRFFDWKLGGHHIASLKLKEMARPNPRDPERPSGKDMANLKTPPTSSLDAWVGLLCRQRDPLDILDEEALAICMGSRMPQTHKAIAHKIRIDHTLSNGKRLWSHARFEHQFDLISRETQAVEDMDLLMEMSADCESRRSRGKPTEFARDLDNEILLRMLANGMTPGWRDWVNHRVDILVPGKNAKWLGDDQVRMWTKAWMQANPGHDMSEGVRTMLLERRNLDSKSLLEHYALIIQDKPLFRAVGLEAMSQRLMKMAYQGFRGKGQTRTLDALVKNIGWPQEDRPHLFRLGLSPCGAEKSGMKDSLNKMAFILNEGGEAVWGEDPIHTAGVLLGKIHQIIVDGGDGESGSTYHACLTTLSRVLESGSGSHPGALRFCGALATYMVFQKSALTNQCLQTMMETLTEAEQALEMADGKPLHEILDGITDKLKNSKKHAPFQAFKSMAQMRVYTVVPAATTTNRPRF